MSRFAQALRLAEVVSKPGGLVSLRRTRPFSTSAFLIARDLRLGCGELASIVDVGANSGQFCLAAAREFPQASIVAVEPLPDVAETLRRNVAHHERVRVVQCAAGATAGTAPFHRHAYTLSSSILPTTGSFAAVFPRAAGSGAVEVVDVEVARLDDVVDVEQLAGPVLLKLDVQGFEIEALRGATGLLERCDWVLAETAMERVYDGEPTFEEVYEHLRDRGFVFDRPVDLLRGARGTVCQMDVLYRRERR